MINRNTFVWTALLLCLGACTKVKKDDDFNPGAPPSVPGGFVNSSEVAASALVGYWGFNGNYDEQVSGMTATPTGTSFGPGIKGQALQGGINAYALATPSDAVKNLGAYTVSWWMNGANNPNGIAGMVNFADANNFWGNLNTFFENGGNDNLMRFKAIFASNGVTWDFGVQELTGRWNMWNQFILTYDGVDKFVIYANGQQIATGTRANLGPIHFANFTKIVFGTVHFMTTPSLTSGSGNQPWASYFTGLLDEVRIYNRALTSQEAGALFTLEKQGR
ncbi:MAG: LamG domain-containing protein [Chitinophagaceae bacterium]|nr:MAG: LamG domain-containing protein [Chitinophagaceae bacterium]